MSTNHHASSRLRAEPAQTFLAPPSRKLRDRALAILAGNVLARWQALSGVLLVAMTSCAAFDKGHVEPRVAAQITVSKIDPPAGCEYLGAVDGSAAMGDLNDAHGDVLRNAALRGGNYVAVDMIERPVILGFGPYVVRGRLFACPLSGQAVARPTVRAEPPAPPAPPRAPAASDVAAPRACEPDCAPGFTCQLGSCVAAPSPQAAGN